MRSEYPRPQFTRPEWLNLNGPWEFCFDDADEGLTERWQEGRRLEGTIEVPFAYQCSLSGINDKGIHEIVWYARDFEVPAKWPSGCLLLHFGAVDYRCTAWLNGQEVGHNRGGHVPFTLDIAPYLKDGANRLVLRVEDRQDPKQPRGKQASSGLPQGIDYYCTTGIWQTVWLEPVPPVRIEELRITPQPKPGVVELTVSLHAPSTGWRLQVEVRDGEKLVCSVDHACHCAVASLRLEVPKPKPWSPDSPHLYDLTVRLFRGEELLDEVGSYFGLRTIRLENGQFLLNGQPLYLAMVLDQGYWPDGYLTASCDEALRADVEWIKRFGFNGARKHQKIEDPRWLYWCDRLGLLVWGEMPNGRAWSLEAEEMLAAEWERAVCRDYNHPCVIAWVPVNESMGFPNLRAGHAGEYAFLERMVLFTRSLDATRPVIDNDGWEHTDIPDIIAIHDYSHSAEKLHEHFAAALAGGALPERIWSGSRVNFARGSSYRGQPIMLTEVGGFLLLPELPADQLDRLYKVYSSFRSPEELLAKYEDLMAGIAGLPFVSGFCYTQLTDIEQEINGLLTFDRRPKIDPERVAEVHRRFFTGSLPQPRVLPPSG